MAYNRVARGMLHEDRITYALLLARIHLKGLSQEPSYDAEFDHLLRGGEVLGLGHNAPPSLGNIQGLSSVQTEALAKLSLLPQFTRIPDKVKNGGDAIQQWLTADNPEKDIPQLWEEKTPFSQIGVAVHRLLLIQALRPDRFLAAAHILVSAVMGDQFMPEAERVLDLATIVEKEIQSSTPILLCSVPGYDASGRVDDLAAELGKNLVSIAIGTSIPIRHSFLSYDNDVVLLQARRKDSARPTRPSTALINRDAGCC